GGGGMRGEGGGEVARGDGVGRVLYVGERSQAGSDDRNPDNSQSGYHHYAHDHIDVGEPSDCAVDVAEIHPGDQCFALSYQLSRERINALVSQQLGNHPPFVRPGDGRHVDQLATVGGKPGRRGGDVRYRGVGRQRQAGPFWLHRDQEGTGVELPRRLPGRPKAMSGIGLGQSLLVKRDHLLVSPPELIVAEQRDAYGADHRERDRDQRENRGDQLDPERYAPDPLTELLPAAGGPGARARGQAPTARGAGAPTPPPPAA